MRKSLLTGSLLGTLLAFVALSLPAHAAVQNRISQQVNNSARTPLTGAIHPRARLAADQGAIASDRQLTDLTIRFSMTSDQEAALDQLLIDQQNPASPKYHQWLTPEQFGAQFGVSAADLAKVTAWLTSQGLTVTGTARSSNFITFNGTAAQVEQAFGVTLHSLNENGAIHFANLTEPTVPAAIASVVSGVTGLDDFHPRARARSRVVPSSEATPKFTSSISGSHYIAPGDYYTIYDINPLLTAGINGTGVSVAVMGQVDLTLTDVASFRSASGLAANVPTLKLYGTDPGPAKTGTNVTPSIDDLDESLLDVEWSGAVAPSANIIFVYGQDVFANSMTQAIANNIAPIISVSYGDCESGFGTSYIASYQALFKQANAQGQTISGPGGDSGATDCDYQVTSATGGLAVDFPASSPNVTGMGGSMFNEGSINYWNSTNGAYMGSAISYIPEQPWNETATDGVTASGAVTSGDIAGGGGGASSYFTKPAWQTGTGVPNDYSRDVPDLALNAAFVHDAYLYCEESFCTNGYRNSSGNLDTVGGTSAAAPGFAGILALLEQKIGSRIGNANPTIYALANSTYYSNVFHDITTGNNAMPCTAGSTNCPSGGEIGYNATTGYDQASGWGSLDVNAFVTDWPLVTAIGITGVGANTSQTVISGVPASVTSGTSITATATVSTGSSSVTTTPTGTVQFLVDGTASGSAVALANGTASYTVTTTSLASGAHTITAVYSGDSVYTGSKTLTSFNVTSATAGDFTITPATASVTVKSGAVASPITFTLTSVNGFAGSISFSASANITGTYGFSPTSVTLTSGSSATTALTLEAFQSNSQTGIGLHRFQTPVAGNMPLTRSGKWIAGSGIALAGLLLVTLPRRRRWAGLFAALLSVGILTASGCGGSSTSATATNTNTPTGTYSITVSATSSTNTTHTATVTFIVQ